MKKLLKWLTALVLIPLVLLLLVVQFLGGDIGRKVIAGLNEDLNTEITAGEVSTSLLSAFPYLSVELEDFRMLGSDATPLLEAKRVSCRIGLGSLFGRPHVKTITVSDGALRIYVDPDGNTNYHILAYRPLDEVLAEEDQPAEPVTFAIDDARLEAIELIYQNDQLGLESAAFLYDANFRGDFGAERYDLATTVNAQLRFIDQGDQRYLAGQSLRIGAVSQVNNPAQTYTFEELYLGLGGLNLRATGSMRQAPDGWDTDLRLNSEEGTLTDLLLLLPETYRAYVEGLSSRGRFQLTGTVSERWTEARQPRLDFRLGFSDGRLSGSNFDAELRDINFEGRFSNGPRRSAASSVFTIEKLSGRFGRQPFELDLRLENFTDPTLSLGLDGVIPGAALPGLFPGGTIQDGSGQITVEGLRLEGRLADMRSPRRIGRVRSGGRFLTNEVAMSVNGRPLEVTSGDLVLSDNRFRLEDLRLRTPGNDLMLAGEATNLIPVLFADSLNSQDAKLTFRGRLRAAELNLNKLLALTDPTEAELAAATTEAQTDSLARKSADRKTRIVDLLEGRFDAAARSWRYGEFTGQDFRGELDFADRKISVRGQTEATGGQYALDGELAFLASPRLTARVKASGIDAETFFRQSENFGQEVLTDNNIRGRLDSRLYLRTYFTPTYEVDYDKLLVLAELDIADGELRDFEMLENFSAVLKARDLARVRFTRLQNFLEVSNQTVRIPVMFIQSSAMNMTLSGDHTFGQVIDYNIKVNAGQVLANKIARHDRDLRPLPARRNGFFNLYYTVKGNLDEYEVKTDKREVKRDFERSEYHRNRIRRALQNEFKENIEAVEEPAEWSEANPTN